MIPSEKLNGIRPDIREIVDMKAIVWAMQLHIQPRTRTLVRTHARTHIHAYDRTDIGNT